MKNKNFYDCLSVALEWVRKHPNTTKEQIMLGIKGLNIESFKRPAEWIFSKLVVDGEIYACGIYYQVSQDSSTQDIIDEELHRPLHPQFFIGGKQGGSPNE